MRHAIWVYGSASRGNAKRLASKAYESFEGIQFVFVYSIVASSDQYSPNGVLLFLIVGGEPSVSRPAITPPNDVCIRLNAWTN